MLLIMLKGTLSRLAGLQFDLVKWHLKIVLFSVFLNYQPVVFIMLLFISPAPRINKVMGECSLLKQWTNHRNSMIEANVPILNTQVKTLCCKTYFSSCKWVWPVLPLWFAIRSPRVEAMSCKRNLQERARGWGDQVQGSLQLRDVPVFHGVSISQ